MRTNRLQTLLTALGMAPAILAGVLGCKDGPTTNPGAPQPVPVPDAARPVTRMSLPEWSFEAGDVTRGDEVAHTFVFKNISDQVFHIKRAHGS